MASPRSTPIFTIINRLCLVLVPSRVVTYGLIKLKCSGILSLINLLIWRLCGYTSTETPISKYYQESYYSYLRKSAVSTSNLYVNMVILRGLKAATRYQIAVSAFRSKGAGTQPYWHYITLWPGPSKLG